MNCFFTTKDRRTTVRWVGKAETQSQEKSHSQHGMAICLGGNLTSMVLLPKNRRASTPSGTPIPGICTRQTGPQNVWLRKLMGLMSRDPKWHKKQCTGLMYTLTCPKIQFQKKKKKSRSFKSVQRLLCEGNWFANPKAHAGGAEDS